MDDPALAAATGVVVVVAAQEQAAAIAHGQLTSYNLGGSI
jgi:hypothetical protein